VKNAIGNLVLLGVSAVLGVLLLEFAARSLHIAPEVLSLDTRADDSAYRLSDNPVLGYVMKPGYRDNDFPDLHRSFPYINSAGFRDIERRADAPAGTARLILLGDSVVAGVGIREIDDLMSRQLERQLAALTALPHEVLNMGVPGYCTFGEVELLETAGLRYHPDGVVLLFVENDYNDGNFLFGEFSIERPAAAEYLFLRSALFRWASLRWDWFSFGALVQPGQTATERASRLVEYSSRRFMDAVGAGDSHVIRALQRLKELSATEDFRVLVAIWPRFYPDFIAEGDHDLIAGEIAVEKLARDLGFEVLRLSGVFQADFAGARSSAGGKLNALDLYTLSRGDPMHPNPRGAAIAAQAIAAAWAGNKGPPAAGNQ